MLDAPVCLFKEVDDDDEVRDEKILSAKLGDGDDLAKLGDEDVDVDVDDSYVLFVFAFVMSSLWLLFNKLK